MIHLNTTLVIVIMVFLLSCDKREWENPFDLDCPKEIYTPTTFTAIQHGNGIKLDWVQNNSNISGYVLYKNTQEGEWILITTFDKEISTYTDNAISGGIKYGYRLFTKAGFNYSNEMVAYCTPLFGASLTTTSLSVLTSTSANSGGTISSDGGSPIIARGVCWSKSTNPTISNSKTLDSTGIGNFTSTLEGLQSGTTYYVRAYAVNGVETTYGNEIRFPFFLNVPGPSVTDVDGNTYKSVRIGDQIWMAENLKTTKYSDGTAIPYVTDKTTWAGLTSGAYCYFVNSTTNGAIYGGLYNFYAAIDNRNICPLGWHVPADSEWITLRDYLGGENVAGAKLRETGTEHWSNTSIEVDNSTGFTALAGSWRGDDGVFYYWLGHAGWWWSSSLLSSSSGVVYRISGFGLVRSGGGAYFQKNGGCSIRCIKD